MPKPSFPERLDASIALSPFVPRKGSKLLRGRTHQPITFIFFFFFFPSTGSFPF